ncbi:hypothetical protein GCM10023185_39720 [Hymenobacter saemangeumensis]|uniref:Uncharacterized protein n=1 Tax=Hymenobacter saemangeumensis TaxID=1084522 RepID=A0ABP8IRC0_9BACT
MPYSFPAFEAFAEQLRAHAVPLPDAATWAELLIGRLQDAYQALAPYAPASVHPLIPPGPGPALAFEARWVDGRTLLATTQGGVSNSFDSQLTLTLDGALKASVLTAHQRLSDAVATCLGPVPGIRA